MCRIERKTVHVGAEKWSRYFIDAVDYGIRKMSKPIYMYISERVKSKNKVDKYEYR